MCLQRVTDFCYSFQRTSGRIELAQEILHLFHLPFQVLTLKHEGVEPQMTNDFLLFISIRFEHLKGHPTNKAFKERTEQKSKIKGKPLILTKRKLTVTNENLY